MTRYFAFLRAINVGGHTIRMERLRELFEELGFANVATFIASGNVVFESDVKGVAGALERRIEKHLRDALGWEAATFLRTDTELAAIAGLDPFPKAEHTDGQRIHVSFLRASPAAAVRREVEVRSTPDDLLAVHGREAYWLCRTSFRESTAPRELGRLLTDDTTMRNLNTVHRMVKKFGVAG